MDISRNLLGTANICVCYQHIHRIAPCYCLPVVKHWGHLQGLYCVTRLRIIIVNRFEELFIVVLSVVNMFTILHGVIVHLHCKTLGTSTNVRTFPQDCVAWGCIGNSFSPNAKVECAALAEDIDFCPEMKGSGNITARVEDANCYNDFVTIRTDLN